MKCEEVRYSLGVYVLGAIDPAERSRAEAHIARCSGCRDELAAMAGLPALLSRVSEEQIEQMAGPPEPMLEALLAQAARERGRGRAAPRWLLRRGWPMLAAAAGVLVVVGLMFGWLARSGDKDPGLAGPVPTVSHPPTRTVRSTQPPQPGERLSGRDAGTGVWATIIVKPKSSGTYAELHLGGVSPGMRCRLEAVGRDGTRDSLGSWLVPDGEYHDFHGTTMLLRDEVAAFKIVTPAGRELLTIPA